VHLFFKNQIASKKVKNSAAAEIVKAIGMFVSRSPRRTTTESIVRHFASQKGLNSRKIRSAIRYLVDSGEFCYSYELGCSFLQLSFSRPVKVSDRVVLTPPNHDYKPIRPEVLVRLAPGAAFGYGQHPTTRLALKAIETALGKWPDSLIDRESSILDIGTGSGVLVIAAVLMGIRKGTGIDLDPCSIVEAGKNIILNGLGHKVMIKDTPFDTQSGPFSMIAANLRYPTLNQVSTGVARRIKRRGALIVSGIKNDELNNLIKTYESLGFEAQQKWNEKGWAAVLMQKH
jgi:ribosomal protein L11 methyltransferase